MTMTEDRRPEDDDDEWPGPELAPLEDVYPRDDEEEEKQLWR